MVGEPGRQGLGRQRSRHEADGRQHRLCAQEARGHGPARQHDRRVHHRQRRRDHHLPGWRHHPVQGRQAEHLGRRHARSVRRSLAGRHQAGHRQERHLRVARLAAHARQHRRRRKGRRAEEAHRGRPISRHRQDHARWRQPDRIPFRASRKSRRAIPSSTIRAGLRRRFATRTGRSTSRWCPTPPAGFLAGALPFHWAQVVNIKRDPFETSIGSQ